MNWQNLLSIKRWRELSVGLGSVRSSEEFRTEIERDYGRCAFSTAVRRLQDKAQVFPLIQHDAVRTRLTHSIEVSSVARDLCTAIGRWLCKEKALPDDSGHALETIGATCGLIHDLGNPPFGHAGEQAIQQWYVEKFGSNHFKDGEKALNQDFAEWNGNAQTIRLVSKLQLLSDKYGLNLTAATLSASFKYLVRASEIDETRHEYSKPGFFTSEFDVVTAVRNEVGSGDSRNPITYLVEAADDIVYCTVDLEDGLKKHVFQWFELEKELTDTIGSSLQFDEALKKAREKIGTSVPESLRDYSLVQAFRNYVIGVLVPSVIQEFKSRYESIMQGNYHGELTVDCKAAHLLEACRSFLKRHVYRADEILRLELMGRQVIGDLLTVFWEGASKSGPGAKGKEFFEKAYLLMSDNYRTVFEQNLGDTNRVVSEEYCRIQLACDYVAGMTDTFASNLHKRLFNA